MKELNEGIERYRPAAERDATMREFHEMAAKSGETLRAVIREFVGIEHLIRNNPIGGLQLICKNAGLDFHDVLAGVLEADAEAVA